MEGQCGREGAPEDVCAAVEQRSACVVAAAVRDEPAARVEHEVESGRALAEV